MPKIINLLVLCSLLLLFSLVFRESSAQTLYSGGTPYANNSAINIGDIGEDTLSLSCRTTRPNCCKSNPQGEWYYPDGTLVPVRSANRNFYRNRDDSGNVKLNRRNNAQSPRGVYSCILPNSRGVMTKLTVFIFSERDYPEIVDHPQSQLNVDPGSSVSFSVTALRGSSYLWYHGTSPLEIDLTRPNKYDGRRSNTLTVHNVNAMDEGTYSCVVGSRVVSVISNNAQLTLLPPPLIVTQPVNAFDARRGSNVTFSVEATGLRLSYIWQHTDEVPLTGDRFIDVDSSELTIKDVALGDAGLYVCVVSNGAGSVRSEGAMLTISGNHEVPSLNVTTAITSATLNWTNPMGEPLTSFVYELQYHPSLFPFYTVTLNTTLTSHEVVKLIPQLRYEFRLRVYTTLEHGDWITVSTLLERKIPPVTDLEAAVINGTSILVSWTPPEDLPGWNITHYYLTYKVTLPKKARPENTLRRTVRDGRTSMRVDLSEFPTREGLLHEVEVVPAIEIAGVEGIGEVKGEKALFNSTFEHEKLPFQLMVGPIQYCINWEEERAVKVEKALQEAVVAAINTRCNCLLPESTIRSGVFSCRGAENVVTYRSTVVGLNATQLIGYLQDWVSSATTITMDWYLMDVYSACPVGIAQLDEPECQTGKILG